MNSEQYKEKVIILIGDYIVQIYYTIILINYSFEILRKYDVVIGPTYDGGFWLIGYSTKKKYLN